MGRDAAEGAEKRLNSGNERDSEQEEERRHFKTAEERTTSCLSGGKMIVCELKTTFT